MREKLELNARSCRHKGDNSSSTSKEQKSENVAPESSGRKSAKSREEKMREKLKANLGISRRKHVKSSTSKEKSLRSLQSREEKMRKKLALNVGTSRRQGVASSLSSKDRRREKNPAHDSPESQNETLSALGVELGQAADDDESGSSSASSASLNVEDIEVGMEAESDEMEDIDAEDSDLRSEFELGVDSEHVNSNFQNGPVLVSAAMNPTMWSDDVDHIDKTNLNDEGADTAEALAKAKEKELLDLAGGSGGGVKRSSFNSSVGGIYSRLSGRQRRESFRFVRGERTGEEEKVASSPGDESDGDDGNGGELRRTFSNDSTTGSSFNEKRGRNWNVRDGSGNNGLTPGAYAMPGINSRSSTPDALERSEGSDEGASLPSELSSRDGSDVASLPSEDESVRTPSIHRSITRNRDPSHRSEMGTDSSSAHNPDIEAPVVVDEAHAAELVPDEVCVDAGEVAIVSEEADDIRLGRKLGRQDKIRLCAAIGVVALGLGIGLGVGLTVGNPSDSSARADPLVEPPPVCEFRSPWGRVGSPVSHPQLSANVVLENIFEQVDSISRAFGSDVSLSDNGERLAVAARLGDAVSVFRHDWVSSSWIRLGSDIVMGVTIKLADVDEAKISSAVVLSGDGNRVAVGHPYHNSDNDERAGKVEVYEYVRGTWTPVGEPFLGPEGNSYLGRKGSIAMSNDGATIAIGDYLFGSRSGRVQVFKLISGVWEQVGGDIVGENEKDQFGASVSLSQDGTMLAAGAMLHTNSRGIARVFRFIPDPLSPNGLNGNSTVGNWEQRGDMIRGGPGYCLFGWPVSLSHDANRIAVTSTSFLGDEIDCTSSLPDDVGEVRMFEYNSIEGVWNQMGPGFTGDDDSNEFGWSISLAGDGNTLAVSASKSDRNNKTDVGFARTFRYQCGNWTQVGSDLDGELAGDRFGFANDLSYNGQRMALGAPTNYLVPAAKSGTVTVFSHLFGV